MLEPSFWISLFLLGCTGIGTATVLVWKLTRVEQALREEIARARTEIERDHDEQARGYMETLMALRQKINDVELDAARTYTRRDGVHSMQERFATEMKSLREAIDARFVRMEEKIDKIGVRD